MDLQWRLRRTSLGRGRLGFVLNKEYELVQVVMIVLDAIVFAWRTQHASESFERSGMQGIQDSVLLVVLTDIFCLWFILDLVCRALAEGVYFFRPGVIGTHCFEISIVGAYLLEVIAVHTTYNEGSKSEFRFWVGFVSFARTLRLLRLVQMSYHVRHNGTFRELRMMMYALTGVMKSLLWSIVVLMVIILIAGTIFTNGCLWHITHGQVAPGSGEGQELEALRCEFGTLDRSMFTLLTTVTGGRDWGEVYLVLGPMPLAYRCFYILFQIFATCALLNVITAVFVDSTMQRSARDRESVVIDEISDRRELMTRLDALPEAQRGHPNPAPRVIRRPLRAAERVRSDVGQTK